MWTVIFPGRDKSTSGSVLLSIKRVENKKDEEHRPRSSISTPTFDTLKRGSPTLLHIMITCLNYNDFSRLHLILGHSDEWGTAGQQSLRNLSLVSYSVIENTRNGALHKDKRFILAQGFGGGKFNSTSTSICTVTGGGFMEV